MNHDEKFPDMQAWIDPELEARVIAWVAGEASAFEAAELERLCGEKPELAVFKRRMEEVHGLIGEAAKPDREPLRLSPERRAKVLSAIAEPAEQPAANVVPLKERAAALPRVSSRWSWRRPQIYFVMSGLAAACFAVLLFQPRFKTERYTAVAKIPFEEPSAQAIGLPSVSDQEVRSANMPMPLRLAEQIREVKNRGGESESQRTTQTSALADQSAFHVEPAPSSELLKNTISADAIGGKRSPAGVALKAGPKGNFANDGRVYFGATGGTISSGNVNLAAPPAEILAASGSVTLGAVAAAPTQAPESGIIRLDSFVVAGQREGKAAAVSVNEQALASVGAPAITVSGTGTRVLAPAAKAETAKLARTELDAKSRQEAQERDERLVRPRTTVISPEAMTAETNAAREAVSTFSLHVSDVSFRLAQAALARGELPEAERIRPEEIYNAFDYGDPMPAVAEKIGCRIEQAAHPFLQQRNLVRIAMKVPASGRGAGQPLRLTVVLDTSGSMEREDRAATVQAAMRALVSLLGPNDRITLIGFARQPRLIADNIAGSEAAQLLDLIVRTPAEGGTNLEEALKLAGEHAAESFQAQAQNRIVLLTDGAANLGNANPAELAKIVETLRQHRIAFDACGVGLDGLDDAVLEELTRKGDGRYTVLDKPEDADAGFARQLAGAFRPAAENVKLQVRFNPARVGNYRLIGFEQHRLREEDFRNDNVDAAELAAEEAAVALYQVEVLPEGSGELGEVFVRFRDPATGTMVERSWTMTFDSQARPFDRAAPSMQLAGTAALLAEKLRGSALAEQFKLGDLAGVVNRLRDRYAEDRRVQELVTMFAQTRRIRGE